MSPEFWFAYVLPMVFNLVTLATILWVKGSSARVLWVLLIGVLAFIPLFNMVSSVVIVIFALVELSDKKTTVDDLRQAIFKKKS